MTFANIDTSKLWTATDYQQLDENVLVQLIENELFISPSVSPLHQRVLWRLNNELTKLNLPGELFFAPIDLYVDANNVFQPDLIYIAPERLHIISKVGIEGTPDLIVEVISPSNSYLDRNIKKKKYLQMGACEYWIIDPANRTVEVYSGDADKPMLFLAEDGLLATKVVGPEGFPLEKIFAST